MRINIDAIDAVDLYEKKGSIELFCAVHLRNGEVIKTDQSYDQTKGLLGILVDIKAL